jgi:hypothetical protein
MSLEIFDMEDNFLTEIPYVNRKGINQALWVPVKKPPRIPRTEAVPFHMRIAIMGGGMRYPAGDYKVKVTKGKQVYEKVITVYDNPDEPYSAEDRILRHKVQQKGFDLMEDLAYLDRKMGETKKGLKGIEDVEDLSPPVKKMVASLGKKLDEITDRLMVTQYGDLRGDTRLREDVGFLYGTISFYDGRPTRVQMDRMDLLERRVREMEKEVEDMLSTSLKSINKDLKKAGLEPIVPSSRAAFDAEDK